jgi:methionine-rich copper-binding protein CopC
LHILKKIASGFAALALGLAAILGISAPANAHAELVEASPAADSLIGALPEYVDLTFGEDIMTIDGSEGSNIITVVDSNGAKVDDETIVVNAAVVSVGIKPGFGNGSYTVTYRVVSEDGHPIEGSYKFEVGDAAQTNVIAPAPSPSASHTDDEHAALEAQSTANTVIAIVAGTVLVAAVGSIVLILQRRKGTTNQ